MTEPEQQKKRGCGKGCLIAIVIGLAMMAYSLWQIREPGKRARRIHDTIKPGMSLTTVESLPEGRYYCFYQVMSNEVWTSISREGFMKTLEQQTNNAPCSTRLWLTFLGMAPNRVSFYVETDGKGNVTKVTDPYGWD